MILPLVYYDDKRLRTKCESITTITDELQTLARDMIETTRANKGLGLAAPQIGKLIRLFVLDFTECDDEGYPIVGDPLVFINPVITNPSKEVVTDFEGCLSIPGLREEVTRPKTITVTALDLDGNEFSIEASDYFARAIMHENDHLNGVLYIDRVPPYVRKAIKKDLQAIKRKYHS